MLAFGRTLIYVVEIEIEIRHAQNGQKKPNMMMMIDYINVRPKADK